MKRPPLLPLVLAVLAPAIFSGRAAAADDRGPLPWINGVRAAAAVPAVREDGLLSAAAGLWAEALAAAGGLSHRGADGSTALDRYRRVGGTEARVGEILGAGPTLADIERAWEASPAHAPVVRRPWWTHAGWGRAPRAGGGWVWVILFSEKLAAGLRIEESVDGAEISGSFLPVDARRPVLLAGTDRVPPQRWDPEARVFLFRLGPGGAAGYFRLGFERGSGQFVLTDAFTLPRGAGSPGATGRFEAPAAPP
jgi:hypothetical protein